MYNAALFRILFLLSFFCGPALAATDDDVVSAVGQKLMLDFRYFCDDETPSHACRTTMTQLSPAIKSLLVDGQIGGVILFSENIQDAEQLVRLNYELQTLMAEHDLPPLFIAIDQEGGRVARIPDHIATRFVGNMAIGASHDDDIHFAQQVADKLASSMKLLGFNVNFAPSVDVNVNPQNPVINVRSYGESPQQVARLGQVTVTAFEQHDVISAIKHFPGHGDTHVDSHTGLPKVNHTKQQVDAVDLLPFKQIIEKHAPAMVMTAHIQYPQLDATRVKTREGKMRVVPATLSKPILTGVLRNELGFEGLIVTDAMDMAGIAHYFSPQEAIVRTFNAGADIALMPFVIRNKKDIKRFHALRHQLIEQVNSGTLNKQQLLASAQRIADTKNRFKINQFTQSSFKARLSAVSKRLPDDDAQNIEQALSDAAITVIKGRKALPLSEKARWRIVMPDAARCNAILNAIKIQKKSVNAACRAMVKLPATLPWQQWSENDVLIVGDITPQHTVAEMGGLDPLELVRQRDSLTTRHDFFQTLMKKARDAGAKTVFISMRAPYNASDFDTLSTVQLATFGYNVEVTDDGVARGAVFTTLAKTLLGMHAPTGVSPVTIESGNAGN